jgi:hypothetical protein
MIKTLILGNGFDLALKIKTSYQDFVDSDEYQDNKSDFEELAYFIEENMEENPLWSGIENDLLNYIEEEIEEIYLYDLENSPDDKKSHLIARAKVINNLKAEFENLKLALQNYLLNLKEHGRENPTNVQNKINEIFSYRGGQTYVYSFNFTPFFLQYYKHLTPNVLHLHDSLTKNNECNIIFGVQSDKLDSRLYNFILKSVAHNYKYYHRDEQILTNRIKLSDEIYFYGYSFGQSDSTIISNIFTPEIFMPHTKVEFIAESKESLNKMKANLRHIIGSNTFDKHFAHRINGVVV